MTLQYPGIRILHYYNDQIGSDASVDVAASLIGDVDSVVIAAFVTHVAGRQVASRGQITNAVGFAG